MLKLKWTFRHGIKDHEDIERMVRDANRCAPNLSSFDTETTGLHIVLDNPFLLQFGFANTKTKEAYVYYVDIERYPEIAKQAISVMWKIAELVKLHIGHNIKYDMHMAYNIDVPYNANNISDTTIMIRLGTDALPVKRGGAPLSLKGYASQYIDKNARFHEQELQAEKSLIAARFNEPLKQAVKAAKIRWIEAEKFLDDAINDIADLAPGFEEIYNKWYNQLPEKIRFNMKKHYVDSDAIPYNLLNRETVYKYGMYDVVYTIEIAYSLLPVLRTRKQWAIFEQENALIRPLFEMEREGFYMDIDYVKEAQVVLKDYIKKLRRRFKELAGEDLKSSQSKRIKEILNEKFDLKVASSGKEVLEEVLGEITNDPKHKLTVEFIEHLQDLRSMEKWYVTYLMRFIKESKYTNFVYTTVHQAGPVTGRVSADFQQFPKDAIFDNEGNELFRPRNMVKVPPAYHGIAYLDYSQIELRFQAFYTILVGNPDLNLSRAYMPYLCYKVEDGVRIPFDYNNREHIKTYKSSIWLLEEDDSQWHPTDIHGATTLKAFPEYPLGSDEHKYWRGKVGKHTNFAKNYGAQLNRVKVMFRKFNFSEEKLKEIDESYYKAFPGVRDYQSYCFRIAKNGYMTNMFGRRYYNISGHNGINALIQGSSADFLKWKIIELSRYIKERGLKSRMVMNIHDEIQFYMVEDEWYELWNFQKIMEDFPETKVPIVADIEVSMTLWGEKEEVDSVQDINELTARVSAS